jgi:hypothetical protein
MTAEYLCLTLKSRPDESEPDFKLRLSTFWTKMLREHPDDFERVYAETVNFELHGDQLSRQYLVEASVIPLLEIELRAIGIEFDEVDPEEVYSKYEATPPEWMWIEH